MQESHLASMFDELEKIGASRGIAGFLQSRLKIRPIRVATLLRKMREEHPKGLHKKAAEEPSRKKKIVGHFAQARPYISSAVKSALPAAVVGKILVGEGPKGSKAARIFGVAGGALGVADRALQNWAQRNKKDPVAKKVLQSTSSSPLKII